MPSNKQYINWIENDEQQTMLWRSESGNPPPKRVVLADDKLSADSAYRMACEGFGLLWRGDFQNVRQLLQALTRRLNKTRLKNQRDPSSMTEAFHWHRQNQIQKARILGMLLIPLNEGYKVTLRRAPDVVLAFQQVYGLAGEPSVISLRELQGLVGAYEWRKTGILIPALNAEIYPHYGVYSPVRGEYINLIEKAALPENTQIAYDIGVGTGVLSAILARRGVGKIIATDLDSRALTCAQENLARLGLLDQVNLQATDLFPKNVPKAQLIICNPPWLPARANAPIERAVYDPNSQMLKGFLAGLSEHLSEKGEGWLILSDLAEHLGLRVRAELLDWIATAGLHVLSKLDVSPKHGKVFDEADALHAARIKEVTSLWRLAVI